MKNIIEINNLTKSYGKLKAVSDLSFKVKEGELFAFLGVNGAGKSTTINILCQTLTKNSGQIIIDGIDIDSNEADKIKSEIGVVFQSSVLDKPLSVYDNLAGRAALYGIIGDECKARIAELAKMLDFEDLFDRRVGKLSGGQRRRIDIARALIHRPKILVLDEPTTGLHAADVHKLIDVLQTLVSAGNTVLVIEHNLDVIKTADYVIDLGPEGGDGGGYVVASGTPEQVAEVSGSYTGAYLKPYLK